MILSEKDSMKIDILISYFGKNQIYILNLSIHHE
jgi:hypothetical protein